MRVNYRKLLLGIGAFFVIPLWGMEGDSNRDDGGSGERKVGHGERRDQLRDAVHEAQALRQRVLGQRQFHVTRRQVKAVVDSVKAYGPAAVGAIRQELPNALPRVQEHVAAIASSESLSPGDRQDIRTIIDKVRRHGPGLMDTLEQQLRQRINTLAVDEDTRARISNLLSTHDPDAFQEALEQEASVLWPAFQAEVIGLAVQQLPEEEQEEIAELFMNVSPQMPQLARAAEGRLPEIWNDLKDHGSDAARRIGARVLGQQLTPEQQAELDRIEREADDLLRNTDIERMISDAERQINQDEEAREEQRRERVRWQHTLLWSTAGASLGLYNQDVLKGSLWALNMMLDMFLYKRLQVIRIAKINNEIKAHYEELLELLTKLRKDQETFDKEYDEKSLIGKMLIAKKSQRNALADPLRAYIRKDHALIYSNPFRQETIFPLALRFAVEKLGSLLEQSYLERVPMTDPLHWSAFKCDERGQRVELDPPGPVSVVTLIRKGAQALTNPISALTSLIYEGWYDGADFIYNRLLKSQGKKSKSKLAKMGYTALRAAYSTPGKIAIKFLELGLAAKIFDTVSSDIWIDYILKKQDKLIDILTQYKDAKDSFKDTAILKEIEVRIQKFVQQGHEPVTFIPGRLLRQWFSARNNASAWTSALLALPVFGIVGWKCYQWYKATIGKNESAAAA